MLSELVSREVPAAKWSPELNRDVDVRRVEGTTALDDGSVAKIEVVEGSSSLEVTSDGAEAVEVRRSAEEVVSEAEDDKIATVEESSEVGSEVSAIEVDPDPEIVVSGCEADIVETEPLINGRSMFIHGEFPHF
jgi:hypothetical protein